MARKKPDPPTPAGETNADAGDNGKHAGSIPTYIGPDSYERTPGGLIWHQPLSRGGTQPVQLSTFNAEIVEHQLRDDGQSVQRYYLIAIDTADGRHIPPQPVRATEFSDLRWARDYAPPGAIVCPGPTIKEHFRTGVEALSRNAGERTIYTHTGWRRLPDNRWGYLHTGGAITAKGNDPGMSVELPSALAGFRLPNPPTGQDAKDAANAVLDWGSIAPGALTTPLWAALFRSVLGQPNWSLHLSGRTGVGKTALALLVQSAWGAGFSTGPAANWSSTPNAIERLAFITKDAILLVDDFVPTPHDNRLQTAAERVFRAQGNRTGRLRLKSDSTLQETFPPRGLILSTGEDVPAGESLNARLLLAPVDDDTALDWTALTKAQAAAAAGLPAAHLAWVLQFWAADVDATHDAFARRSIGWRPAFHSLPHRRQIDLYGDMMSALELWTAALATLLPGDPRVPAVLDTAAAAVTSLSGRAMQLAAMSDPAVRFTELLQQAVAAGRAHYVTSTGAQPDTAERYGWHFEKSGKDGVWRPGGDAIGWLDNDLGGVHLLPDAAHRVAADLGRAAGHPILIGPREMRTRLHTAGRLRSTEKDPDGTVRLTVRNRFCGKLTRNLHLRLDDAPEDENTHTERNETVQGDAFEEGDDVPF